MYQTEKLNVKESYNCNRKVQGTLSLPVVRTRGGEEGRRKYLCKVCKI